MLGGNGCFFDLAFERVGNLEIGFNKLSPWRIFDSCVLRQMTSQFCNDAASPIIFENNATSQFGKLIKIYTGIEIENKVLKYNGLPFSVEEVKSALEDIK